MFICRMLGQESQLGKEARMAKVGHVLGEVGIL